MPNTTDPRPGRKEGLQKLWSRFRFIAAVTSPFWMLALMIEGSLGHRLLGAGLLLLIPISVLYSWRWVAYGFGFLAALRERQEEKKRGEVDDARHY